MKQRLADAFRIFKGYPDPEQPPSIRAQQSGVVAAVTVLRTVLSLLNSDTVATIFSDTNVQTNPVLAAALLKMELQSVEKAGEALDLPDRSSPPSTFENLMQDTFMSSTVWQHPDMLLCGVKLVYNERRTPIPEPDALANAEKLSVVHWDGLSATTMSNAVQAHIDEHIVRNEEYFRHPLSNPTVIRAVYDGRNAPIHTWRGDLAQLRIQIPTVYMASFRHKHGNLPNKLFIQFLPKRWIRYRCVAVVKLREAPDEEDRIRVFSIRGAELHAPLSMQREGWDFKIEDGGRFYLFYVTVPDNDIDEVPRTQERPIHESKQAAFLDELENTEEADDKMMQTPSGTVQPQPAAPPEPTSQILVKLAAKTAALHAEQSKQQRYTFGNRGSGPQMPHPDRLALLQHQEPDFSRGSSSRSGFRPQTGLPFQNSVLNTPSPPRASDFHRRDILTSCFGPERQVPDFPPQQPRGQFRAPPGQRNPHRNRHDQPDQRTRSPPRLRHSTARGQQYRPEGNCPHRRATGGVSQLPVPSADASTADTSRQADFDPFADLTGNYDGMEDPYPPLRQHGNTFSLDDWF
ncbi:hypothetical protein QBC34DRAFT_377231 [Podospora aff. communis PSN243]|uniref:Uncharacterized protein n=1 Tax=Podospora aff. communis PSN243 TaxID=3040156 RepID=A0AAV9GUW9_9PEZI|nr:hypothetical protein QBC34DRAFT_377231 [Podospora aff. communis PSN243]